MKTEETKDAGTASASTDGLCIGAHRKAIWVLLVALVAVVYVVCVGKTGDFGYATDQAIAVSIAAFFGWLIRDFADA